MNAVRTVVDGSLCDRYKPRMPERSRWRHVGAIGGCLALVSACGGSASRNSPEAAVAELADALRAGRFGDAYDLMSEDYRRRVSEEEFEHRLESTPDEARDTAEALSKIEGPAEVTAVVPYGEDEHLTLVLEDSDWRIANNVADFYDQSTPRNALRSFVRAMERRRYDVVLRFVPKADLEGMTPVQMRAAWEGEGREDVERLLASLRASLDHPIEVIGDRATMLYGDRQSVQFIREDGVWKIEDPD